MLERLQKILSARGIASRRKAEEYITAGLVKVNGTIATLGQKADPDVDQIEVDGQVLKARQEMMYYVMYKPEGVITSNLEGDRGLQDLIPKNLRGKIYPVGRLDKDSEGLLLLTNDGVLAYRLTHPKFDHEKEYEVTVTEPMTDGQMKKLSGGLKLDEEELKPAVVKKINSTTFRIALTEGKNRQIRRMVKKVGGEVKTLKRVRIMTLEDQSMKPGQVRELSVAERTQLLASIGV